MSDTHSDFQYVKRVIVDADTPNSHPYIYLLWGVIVLAGYTLAEFNTSLLNEYWLIATPIGIAGSYWLGARQGKQSGQISSKLGSLYLQHFGLLTLAIFLAAVSGQYQSILLIIGIGYCLAGIHLERTMLWIGLLTLLAYVGVISGLIGSNLILGVVISAGLFFTAWTQRGSKAGD